MKKRVVKERNNFWMYLVIILLLVLIGSCLIYFRLTGNVIYNEGDYGSTDFAPPYDVFDGNKLIFTVSPEKNIQITTTENLKLNITVNQAGGFIYNKAYYYNTNISDWVEFTFSQPTVGNSSWIASSATANINIPSNSLNNGNNLIATYSCKKYGGVWECGCQNTNESNCASWMLQIVNVTITQVCTNHNDCNNGEYCKNSICTSFIPGALASGLVAYYPFDSNVYDYSSYNRTSTNFGGESASGKIRGAYYFSGTGKYVNASDKGLPAGSSPRTFSGWFKVTNKDFTDNIGIINYGTPRCALPGSSSCNNLQSSPIVLDGRVLGNNPPWYPFYRANSIGWIPYGSTHTSTHKILDTNWHNFVVTYPGIRYYPNWSRAYNIYIDGNNSEIYGNVYTINWYAAINTVLTGELDIGIWPNMPNVSGVYLDEVAIWNRSLSSQEAAELYNSGNGLSLIGN